MDLTNRPADAAAPHQLPPQERAGDELLVRALRRARWTIFWERLWPALASLATVIGLFLALSWLGLWLWLPPTGRAIGLGVFFLLTAARSEEHTSELQSLRHLVCRLLLEKNK